MKSIKSWLQTVEDMNYIGAAEDSLTTLNLPHSHFSNQRSVPNPPFPNKEQLLSNKLSTNGRVLIRPARLRVRRCSISSATAALSLADNGGTCFNSFSDSSCKESNGQLTSTKSISMLNISSKEVTPSLEKSVVQMENVHQTSKSPSWLLKLLVIISVSSNVLLFVLLVFNVYKTN